MRQRRLTLFDRLITEADSVLRTITNINTSTGVLTFTPALPGLYVFELEVDDGAVRSAPAPIGVLVFPVANGGRP